jgi:hypothetical protein
MAEKITYYALVWPGHKEPTGIARRREDEQGTTDEALWEDMNWHFTPTIVEWKRADSTEDLVEISEEEAKQLIEQFRQQWGASSG